MARPRQVPVGRKTTQARPEEARRQPAVRSRARKQTEMAVRWCIRPAIRPSGPPWLAHLAGFAASSRVPPRLTALLRRAPERCLRYVALRPGAAFPWAALPGQPGSGLCIWRAIRPARSRARSRPVEADRDV